MLVLATITALGPPLEIEEELQQLQSKRPSIDLVRHPGESRRGGAAIMKYIDMTSWCFGAMGQIFLPINKQ